MTTSIVPNLNSHTITPPPHQNYHSQYCTLQWRRGQLLVKPPSDFQQPYLPSLDNQQLLVECLKNSPVNVVTIDPKLGYAALQFWADACQQANKPLFVSMSSRNQFSTLNNPVLLVIQRLVDWILALISLLLISPFMLGLIVIMRLQSFDVIFAYNWHIGGRGKLFRAIKFCTTKNNHSTGLGLWMRKYGLDNLPLLFNVLCGEMSLIKYRCWCLEDVIKLRLERKEQQLNELPEVITAWQIETEYETARLS